MQSHPPLILRHDSPPVIRLYARTRTVCAPDCQVCGGSGVERFERQCCPSARVAAASLCDCGGQSYPDAGPCPNGQDVPYLKALGVVDDALPF